MKASDEEFAALLTNPKPGDIAIAVASGRFSIREIQAWRKGMTRASANQTKVYLAFHGQGGQVTHLKIGVAENVKRRMGDFRTGNPLDRILTFASPFANRIAAIRVESALLKHMSHSKAHGEWVHFKASEQACRALAESLAEVAAEVSGHIVAFSEL